MPFEDGISKATKNLDKATGAAPISRVVHATEDEKKKEDTGQRAHDEERTPEAEQDDSGEHDDSDD